MAGSPDLHAGCRWRILMLSGKVDLPPDRNHPPVNDPASDTREKRKIMNEFQAILTEIIFFGARFAVPAAIVYTLARIARHYALGPEKEDTPKPDLG
jgi:hypothetical protein